MIYSKTAVHSFIHFQCDLVEAWLHKEEADGGALRDHLSAVDGLHTLPLQSWFNSCFANILPLSSIERYCIYLKYYIQHYTQPRFF